MARSRLPRVRLLPKMRLRTCVAHCHAARARIHAGGNGFACCDFVLGVRSFVLACGPLPSDCVRSSPISSVELFGGARLPLGSFVFAGHSCRLCQSATTCHSIAHRLIALQGGVGMVRAVRVGATAAPPPLTSSFGHRVGGVGGALPSYISCHILSLYCAVLCVCVCGPHRAALL